jgi:hypothetical protein
MRSRNLLHGKRLMQQRQLNLLVLLELLEQQREKTENYTGQMLPVMTTG